MQEEIESGKYPRTYHLPFSPGSSNDDKIQYDLSKILNVPIVLLEKLDGSNVSMERYNCFARSHSGPPTHQSFDYFKSIHSTIKFLIDENVQIFAEYLYAQHSLNYDKLPHYCLIFGVRDLVSDKWYSWENVKLLAKTLDIPTAPVIYDGLFKSKKELEEYINEIMKIPSCFGSEKEGIVIRVKNEFYNKDFSKSCLKFVRASHVKTNQHWKEQKIIPNKLLGH